MKCAPLCRYPLTAGWLASGLTPLFFWWHLFQQGCLILGQFLSFVELGNAYAPLVSVGGNGFTLVLKIATSTQAIAAINVFVLYAMLHFQ